MPNFSSVDIIYDSKEIQYMVLLILYMIEKKATQIRDYMFVNFR